MKLTLISLLLGSLTVIALLGCGSSLYVNSSYPFADIQEPTFALFPALHPEGAAVIDTIFEDIFGDLTTHYQIISPSEIRSAAQSSREYSALLTKLATSDVQSQSLQILLTAKELSSLRKLFPGTRFLYVPAQFSLKEATPGTALGKVTFRLYDIETGALVLEDSDSFNVMPNGTLRSGGLISAMGVGTTLDPSTSSAARFCVAIVANHGKKSLQTNFLAKTKTSGSTK